MLFQDGGPGGDEITNSVLAGVVERLKPNGMAVVLSMFPDQKGRPYPTRIKKWIGAKTPVELQLFKIFTIDPEELAAVLTWKFFDDDFDNYTKRYRAWLQGLKANDVTNLTYGVLVVRSSDSFSFRCGDLPLANALNKNYSAQLLTF